MREPVLHAFSDDALGDADAVELARRIRAREVTAAEVLDAVIARAEAAGIARDRIIVDPGIGFGKTLDHNLTLIRGISLFHGLGCPILLGVSRKRFIGTLADEPQADRRGPGTIAVTLAAIAQGVQIHRVHDTQDARQALHLWRAVTKGALK